MKERIFVTEPELVALINASVGRALPLAFGPGWCAVLWEKATWVLPILAKLRGIEAQAKQ